LAGIRPRQGDNAVGKDGRTYNIEKIQEAQKKPIAKVTTAETTTTKEVDRG